MPNPHYVVANEVSELVVLVCFVSIVHSAHILAIAVSWWCLFVLCRSFTQLTFSRSLSVGGASLFCVDRSLISHSRCQLVVLVCFVSIVHSADILAIAVSWWCLFVLCRSFTQLTFSLSGSCGHALLSAVQIW